MPVLTPCTWDELSHRDVSGCGHRRAQRAKGGWRAIRIVLSSGTRTSEPGNERAETQRLSQSPPTHRARWGGDGAQLGTQKGRGRKTKHPWLQSASLWKWLFHKANRPDTGGRHTLLKKQNEIKLNCAKILKFLEGK